MHVLAAANLRLDASAIDYVLLAFYFVLVLGIGYLARRQVSTSLDFFLSGRSLPAWVTGLAFISANLGAIEVMGMSANGAQYGLPTAHYFWIGAVPAMLFLGVVMMPFYYGSKVRSVPEWMRKRFGSGAHLVTAITFAVEQLLIAGINLYLLAKIVNIFGDELAHLVAPADGMFFGLRALPSGFGSIAPSVMQIGQELDNAARVSGADWVRTFTWVLGRLLTPAFAGAVILTFVTMLKEYSPAIFLGSANSTIIGTTMLELWVQGNTGSVAALATIQIAITAAFVGIAGLLMKGHTDA